MDAITHAAIAFVDVSSGGYLLVRDNKGTFGFPRGEVRDGETVLYCALHSLDTWVAVPIAIDEDHVIVRSQQYGHQYVFTVSGKLEGMVNAAVGLFSLNQIRKLELDPLARRYFRLGVPPSPGEVFRDGIAFVSGPSVLTLRSVDGYHAVPFSLRGDLMYMVASVGIRLDPSTLNRSKHVLVDNVDYSIVHIPERAREAFSRRLDFTHSDAFDGYEWMDTRSGDEVVRAILSAIRKA